MELESGETLIVECRAGKCEWDEKMVTPLAKKGMLRLVRDADELHHVQWFDVDASTKEDDWVTVEDVFFTKVEKVNDGRVFCMKNAHSETRMFYWMQTGNVDGDLDIFKKMNDAIACEERPAHAPSGASGSAPAAASGSA